MLTRKTLASNIKTTIRITIVLGLCILYACQQKEFEYDPSVPYPELEVGEFWKDKYDRRGLQNGIVKNNLLFVNTINISQGQDYLYCLNISNGKVEWKSKVSNYAAQPVSIIDDRVFYVSYVGKIYAFSLEGKPLWSNQLKSSYSGHKLNSSNNNLLVNTVTEGVFEFDKDSGKEINHYPEDTWGITIYTNKKTKKETINSENSSKK